MSLLIQHTTIVSDGNRFTGSVAIEGGKITCVSHKPLPEEGFDEVVNAAETLLLPGVIDTHVHFRDPGLTHKGDIATESRAAAAGGVTTALDMPNTLPQTIDAETLLEKAHIAAEKSVIRMGFYLGATKENAARLAEIDPSLYCGIKVFLGASTGNMLLDTDEPLAEVFHNAHKPVVAHCEDQSLLSVLYKNARKDFPNDAPIAIHSDLRPAAACVSATCRAITLAERYGTRLHIAHVSTAEELDLIAQAAEHITAEVCPTYLLCCRDDYARLGARIKCNPAVKTATDRDALRRGLADGRVYTIGTDHAPHRLREKRGGALRAASGIPMVQFSLPVMLDLAAQGFLTYEHLVELMCHNPANLFGMNDRGYIRAGLAADLVLIRPHSPWTLTPNKIVSRCGWSLLEGHTFRHRVLATYVGGKRAY